MRTTQQSTGTYKHECEKCGKIIISRRDMVKHVCQVVKQLDKDLISLTARYAAERYKWVQAGKPYRTPERILEIFNNECSQCEHFEPAKDGDGVGSCGICGCRLAREGKFLNKLAWATTECPLAEPKWLAEPLPQPKGLFSAPAEAPQTVEPVEKSASQTPESPPKGGCGCGKRK